MKIQYPGVAEGIESDINNLISVMNVWDILPKGNVLRTGSFRRAPPLSIMSLSCKHRSFRGRNYQGGEARAKLGSGLRP